MIHINPFSIFRLTMHVSLNVFYTSGASAILKLHYINRRYAMALIYMIIKTVMYHIFICEML